MTVQKRYRVQHRFWLDVTKDHDDLLDEVITQLKAQRQFMQVIRDGIRLVVDLQRGSIDVLLELFPWVEDRIAARNADDNGNLRERLARLEGQLAAMERVQYLPPNDSAVMQPAGPRPLGAPQLAKPQYEDDADDVAALKASARKDTSTDSAANFLKSMMNLQAGFDKQQ